MRVVVVGATGTIGRAVADQLAERHEVLRASRNGQLPVDIGDPGSIKGLYARVDRIDAVACCAGDARFGPLSKLTDDDLDYSIRNKLMGQVNLVRFGMDHVSDGGAFVLTSGIFAIQPPPGASVLAMVNGALESFTRAAALDLPRGQRINVVSPPFIHETASAMGIPEAGRISAAENARFFIQCIEGKQTGEIIRPTL